MRVASWPLLLVPLALSCRRTEDPTETYVAYVRALADADFDAAYDRLSSSSRAAVAARRAATALAPTDEAPDIVDDDETTARLRRATDDRDAFRALLAGPGAGRPPPLTRAAADAASPRVVAASDAAATLEVSTPLGARHVRLVREDGAWKIVLEGL